MLPPSHKAAWEALAGVPEERPAGGLPALEGYERPAPMTITEEWILTGDPTKDDVVRNSHRYESAPSSILFKALLELCSSEAVACKSAVDICIVQIKRYLSADQLPRATFNEAAERGFHSAEAFVQVRIIVSLCTDCIQCLDLQQISLVHSSGQCPFDSS